MVEELTVGLYFVSGEDGPYLKELRPHNKKGTMTVVRVGYCTRPSKVMKYYNYIHVGLTERDLRGTYLLNNDEKAVHDIIQDDAGNTYGVAYLNCDEYFYNRNEEFDSEDDN
jgi:hypothetical protein